MKKILLMVVVAVMATNAMAQIPDNVKEVLRKYEASEDEGLDCLIQWAYEDVCQGQEVLCLFFYECYEEDRDQCGYGIRW